MKPKTKKQQAAVQGETPESDDKTTWLVVAGCGVGLWVWTHNVWPAVVTDYAEHVVVPVAVGCGLLLAALLVGWMAVAAARGHGLRFRRHRRRWTKVMRKVELTDIVRGEELVPSLVAVRPGRDVDVLKVRMLETHSPRDWERVAGRIAKELGAGSARIHWTPDRLKEIELTLTARTGKAA